MNDVLLIDAMSNLDSDIIERYFKTKEAFNKKKNNIRVAVIWKKVIPLAACFVLIISSAFSIVIPIINKNQKGDIKEPLETDNVIDLPNIDNPSTDIPNVDGPSDAEEKEEYTTWNGMMVSWDLYNALLEAEDSQELTIMVSDSNIESFYDYVYEGKTYAEYEAELKELRALSGKLSQLKKDGEWLKYGESAYTEGKYSKELYDKKIAFYGEDILNRFIVNGVFLRDDLESHYKENEEKANDIYVLLEKIIKESNRKFAFEHCKIFEQSCYNVELKENVFWLYITKRDFANLSIDKSQYRFDIISTEPYDPDKPVDW
ncbi:MAG: hypothetical protein IJ437_04340 [Clostridia bacterium]|nr:hypothetical protein [Clostridia bacterium]